MQITSHIKNDVILLKINWLKVSETDPSRLKQKRNKWIKGEPKGHKGASEGLPGEYRQQELRGSLFRTLR